MAPVYQFYCVLERLKTNWDTLYSVTENSILSAHNLFVLDIRVWKQLLFEQLLFTALCDTLFCPSSSKPNKDTKIYTQPMQSCILLYVAVILNMPNSNSLIYVWGFF